MLRASRPKGGNMAIKHYESVVIINAALDDPQIEQAIASVQSNLKSNGGEVTDTENWGRKRLAYAINNAKTGYYLITRFTADASTIKEYERSLKLDENIIRYMTIALDKKALEYLQNKDTEQPTSEEETVVTDGKNKEESKD
jgi:small subunit ribosomal protein S6